MAVVVIGALLSSTGLTLVVVPALYSIADDVQNKLFRRQPRPQPRVAPLVSGNGFHDVPRPAPRQHVPLNIADRGEVYLVRMTLPHEVDSDGVTATYADGILELQLPKSGPDGVT